MQIHESRSRYFARLEADPWGFADPTNDWSGEDRFVAVTGPAYLLVLAITILLSHQGVIPQLNAVSFIYFFAAQAFGLLGKAICSYLVLRFKIKINYVRKLGLRPWRKLTAFVIPLLVSKGGQAIPDVCALFALGQLVTIMTEWHVIRRRVGFLRYSFLSWDRIEDRPYSMRYDLLEDVFRFLVYLPFMVIFGKMSLIVMIPNLINEFGDGLAEPVGIRWGRHTYRVKALWYKGKAFAGSFQRSLEGSATVFVISILVLFAYRDQFTSTQFIVALLTLPLGMTIAEAVSPHTADGPLLALVGCGMLLGILAI